MDFNATIDLIIKDLEEAREIIDDLKKYSGVPVLQVEFAKSKCKSAAEVIALLKTTGEDIRETGKEVIKTPKQDETHIPEKKKSIFSPSLNIPLTEEKNISSEQFETTASVKVDKNEGSGKMAEKTHESSILADKFSHLSNRFNEQLGTLKNEEDISDILKSKPLTSLSEAIGLNDKFLFIREIFDGNNDTYNQAIMRLDNSLSLSDARAVLMSYTGNSNENEAVKQLLDLVKRKLTSNE
jgi:hypothetical protein